MLLLGGAQSVHIGPKWVNQAFEGPRLRYDHLRSAPQALRASPRISLAYLSVVETAGYHAASSVLQVGFSKRRHRGILVADTRSLSKREFCACSNVPRDSQTVICETIIGLREECLEPVLRQRVFQYSGVPDLVVFALNGSEVHGPAATPYSLYGIFEMRFYCCASSS